jgi:hypothetical protein
MSRAKHTTTDRSIDITKQDNRWGEYLEVVTEHMRHSFAIIDGTVMTNGKASDEVRHAIEQQGYDVA